MTRSQSAILSELLVLQAQSGSDEALTQLVELWNPRLRSRAYQLTLDREGTNEVLQDTWIGIAHGLRSLRNPERFGPWAYRIVHYKSSDWIQNRVRDRSVSRVPLSHCSDTDDYSASDSAHTIRQAVSGLEPKLREVVYLFYMDHCTIEQIAIVLGIPIGTAKTRLACARTLLKTQLERSIQ